MEQLARGLLSTDPGPVLHALKDKIRASTRGELPHANDILPALYELMQKNEAPKETPTQPSTPSKKDIAGRDWKGLKNALIWSLSSGSFLDSQFYALDSKLHAGTSTIQPIYFCSMVGGAFLPRLVKCTLSTHGYRNVIEPSVRFVKDLAVQQDASSVCRRL